MYFHRHAGEWEIYHEGHVLKCTAAGCPSSQGLPFGEHANADDDHLCDVCGYDMYSVLLERICSTSESLTFDLVGEGEPIPEAQKVTFTNQGAETVWNVKWIIFQEGNEVSPEECYFEIELPDPKKELGPEASVTFSVQPKAWILSEYAENQDNYEREICLVYDFLNWTCQTRVSLIAGDPNDETDDVPAEPAWDVPALAKCDHSYRWNMWYDATSVSDGKMAYQCRYCDDVAEVVTLSAYARFLQETTETVNKAPANAVVDIDAKMWMSISNSVAAAMRENPDVTMNIQFRYDGHVFQITIPAGYDLASKMNGEGYAGFLYLAQDPALNLVMIR